MATCAYSPDGGLLVTGADDAKVKVWDATAGSCFVTFTDHTAPVTAVAFLPNNTALVSASLDGTCRAYDLVRYRNFRTMATPQPVQLASLAVDPGGEVVCAGSLDTFQVSCGVCGNPVSTHLSHAWIGNRTWGFDMQREQRQSWR